MAFSALVFACVAASLVSGRQLTITNNCDYTIWPAVAGTNANSGYNGLRGWEAQKGHSETVEIPDTWNGRVWPRRGCTFAADGSGSCIAGNCAAGLNCADQTMAWEANLFELNTNAYGGNDFWDYSLVPGFIAPMGIVPSGSGCASVVCPTDLNADCPDDRLKKYDTDGTTVIACMSACMAGIDAGTDSNNCCSGAFLDISTCLSSGVEFYSYFKDSCPNAYAYPRDSRPAAEKAPTVDQTCASASKPNYEITFCPSGETTSTTAQSLGEAVDLTSDSKILGMSKSTAFVCGIVFVIGLIALLCVAVLLVRTHKEERAAQQGDEAYASLVHSKSRRYRGASEDEQPVRSRSRRSRG
ncbi:hypothetical protein JCM10207_002384 [Rhodosporidiobolus poonsookiae]